MQIFCIEQNYFANKIEKEIGSALEPVIFVKAATALLQNDLPFLYPAFATELYCTCELVLHISKEGKNIPAISASEYYDFITVGINFVAFDNNENELPEKELWQKTKAWNHSSVTGKWMPAANFSNKKSIDFCLYKNREMVQFCNTGLMVKHFDALIAAFSNAYNLEIGDIVFTGTQINIGELFIDDTLEAFIEDDSLLEITITDFH